jgi:branched-chain amino acid transport system ATP-binding protein
MTRPGDALLERDSGPLLEVRGLFAGYGHVGVLRDVSITVESGRIVGLIGSNGAGKSTLLRTISGLIRPTAGRIEFKRRNITGSPPHKIVSEGLLQVAENRRLFRSQTVADNIELGLYNGGLDAAAERERRDWVLALFPALRDKLTHRAGTLSGGQQQMLAIAQALMRRPPLLMLDEPSLGLAPIIVDQVMEVILRLRGEGVSILLVEQMVEVTLDIADLVYVVQNGCIVGHGAPSSIREGDLLARAYLGAASERQIGHSGGTPV